MTPYPVNNGPPATSSRLACAGAPQTGQELQGGCDSGNPIRMVAFAATCGAAAAPRRRRPTAEEGARDAPEHPNGRRDAAAPRCPPRAVRRQSAWIDVRPGTPATMTKDDARYEARPAVVRRLAGPAPTGHWGRILLSQNSKTLARPRRGLTAPKTDRRKVRGAVQPPPGRSTPF